MVETAIKEPRQWLSPIQALNRLSLPETTVSDPLASAASPQLRYGFRIGDIGLLIQPYTHSETLERASVYPIPNTVEWLKGLINLRGNLVPLFDLKTLLEMQGEVREKPMIIILDEGDRTVGIEIDGLPQAPDLGRGLQRLPPLPTVLRDFATAAYVEDGLVWLEFDHRGFFEALAIRLAA